MYGYVYLITNLINGKKYIGLHRVENDKIDPNYFGSGKLLKQAIEKYGKDEFSKEILHWHETPEELINAEIEEIIERNAINNQEYYNLIATKTPILFGENNGFYSKTHSDEIKEYFSHIRKGKERSKEGIRKVKEFYESEEGEKLKRSFSEKRSGVPLSEETKEKIRKANKGKKRSEEFKERMSKLHRGIEKTEEHKRKLSESWTPEKREYLSQIQKNIDHWWQDKINKNPEKIEKTAEAHRGSKRTEEACQNIKEGVRQYYENGGVNPTKGRSWYHNPETGERKMFIEGNEEKGFIKGKNTFWCHNPETGENKEIKKENGIPEGWLKGKYKRNN